MRKFKDLLFIAVFIVLTMGLGSFIFWLDHIRFNY